jgi:glycosyltransferase involved in cell wall biosynthesis
VIVGIDNITPGTSTSSSLSVGSMRPYMQDILLGLPPLLPEWKFKFFTPSWNEPFEIRHPAVEVIVCPEVSKSRIRRAWFEQTRLPRRIAAENIDIWLGTCNYLPLLARCKTLLIVQSHQFFTNPEAFHPVRRLFLKWMVTMSVKRADRTGVQCEDAKQTLLKYIAVPETSLSVIYNRPADTTGPAQLTPHPRPYLLYISAFYLFKNHPRLIEAFARIRPQFPRLALVLGGGDADGETAARLQGIAERHGVAGDVIFLGRVDRPALPDLYRNAVASVFLSLEETFGLPVLEAMSFDCPVVTSNRSSMAEIAGDAALLADPEDVGAMAAALAQILSDETLRRELRRKGRIRCTCFTKEKTIQNLAAALEAVAA